MPAADYSSYHQLPGTGADGTKLDNFIDAVQATINALDKNNLAAAAGILASQLADPTTGKVLGSSGSACAAVFPPGYEYAYAEKTSNTTTTQTTPTSSTDTIATLAAVTFDGATRIKIEAFVPEVFNSVAANYNNLLLFEDGTFRAAIGRIQGSGTAQGDSLAASFVFTPASGSRTYSLRASVQGGTGTFGAGGGAGGGLVPAYIRAIKA